MKQRTLNYLLSSAILVVALSLGWNYKAQLNLAWADWVDKANMNIVVSQTIPRCINKSPYVTVIGSSFYKKYGDRLWTLRLNIVAGTNITDGQFQEGSEAVFNCINPYHWEAFSLMYSRVGVISTIDDHKTHFYARPSLFIYMDGSYMKMVGESSNIVEVITNRVISGEFFMIGDTAGIISAPIQIDLNSQFGLDLAMKRYAAYLNSIQ